MIEGAALQDGRLQREAHHGGEHLSIAKRGCRRPTRQRPRERDEGHEKAAGGQDEDRMP
jgi:hypothetical protein